jgi:hypothetical protein
VIYEALIEKIEAERQSGNRAISDNRISKLALQHLLELIKEAFSANDKALIDIVANSKSDVLSAFTDSGFKYESERAFNIMSESLSNYLLSPTFYKGTIIRPELLRPLISGLTRISNPFSFIRAFSLNEMSLGFAVEGEAIIDLALSRDIADFNDKDVACMMMAGAKLFGEGDKSFLGWRNLDDQIRYDPLLCGFNRLEVVRGNDLFFGNSYKTSESDWSELIRYDKARYDFQGGDPYATVAESLCQYFLKKLKIFNSDEHQELNNGLGLRTRNAECIVDEILKGKPLKSYTTLKNAFNKFKLLTDIRNNLLTTSEPKLGFSNSTPALRDSFQKSCLTLMANHVSYVVDLNQRLADICGSYLEKSWESASMLQEAQALINIMDDLRFDFRQNTLSAIQSEEITHFVIKAANALKQSEPEKSKDMLNQFLSLFGIKGIHQAIDNLFDEDLDIVVDVISKAKSDEQKTNGHNLYVNSKLAGEMLGKLECRRFGITKNMDLEDVAKSYGVNFTAMKTSMMEVFNTSKMESLEQVKSNDSATLPNIQEMFAPTVRI